MKQLNGKFQANRVDLDRKQIDFVEIHWQEGVIRQIQTLGTERQGQGYLVPGFVDAHVHIESSMLTPVQFSRLAVKHGTVATVSDPHEIANVLGLEGIRFMLDNAEKTPLKILFGAPSCVPATAFETSGATLTADDLESLFSTRTAGYLSEMMNYPGVLNNDPDILEKLALAQHHGVPVDGHAPGLRGAQAFQYAAKGITTEHECVTLDEALDKLAAGMQILIREGSAARNFDALHSLIDSHTEQIMFCSDDKHPDDLQRGHINKIVSRAVALGHNLYKVLRCACSNPVKHYRLPVGQLRVGDPMDAVLLRDLQHFEALQTWIDGCSVADHGICHIPAVTVDSFNRFSARPVVADDFLLPVQGSQVRVIKAFNSELSTEEWLTEPTIQNGCIVPDTGRDILLLCVVNRYKPEKPAVALVHGFGLSSGALASTVAHDSHNIIAVGADVNALVQAINGIIQQQGGIAVVNQRGKLQRLALPVAGLMSNEDAECVAAHYAELDRQAKALGSPLEAPFMTLSFMALLVIPELKLSDRGLFDGRNFQFIELQIR